MTADPEAVTRALADLRQYVSAIPQDRLRAVTSRCLEHLASVLASLPDDRLMSLTAADPDTLTADAPATCNSGTGGGETCTLPRGHSGPHDPDAPHLDFSPENITRLRESALQNYIDTADAPADTDQLPMCGCDATGYRHHPACPVMAAHRAHVETARRDALNQAADDVPHCIGSQRKTVQAYLRQRAARGETRQP